MIARAAAAAALLALAGCAGLMENSAEPGAARSDKRGPVSSKPAPPASVAIAPPVSPPTPPVLAPAPAPQLYRPGDLDALLSDFARLRRLPAAEIAREQEAARQAFGLSRSDAARVRLAMTMAVPGVAGSEDLLRALDLLDPLAKNPAAPLHGLAFLMTAYVQEQRRLASQVQGLQQNAQGLQQNVQALQQKLDALRTLERSLSEREAAGRRR